MARNLNDMKAITEEPTEPSPQTDRREPARALKTRGEAMLGISR